GPSTTAEAFMTTHSKDGRERARGLHSIAWLIAIASIGLTVVGVFWLRLWILGLVVGVIALIVGLVVLRRERGRPFTAPLVVCGALAVALAVAVAVTTV